MKEKQIPIRREVLYAYNMERLEAAINGSEVEQRTMAFLDRSKGIINTFAEFEDKICYSSHDVIPRYVNKYWLHYKPRCGFTYDKKSKTVKSWFGKKLHEHGHFTNEFVKHVIIKELGFNFITDRILDKVPITLRVMNKIVKGKITNPRDYAYAVFKEKFPKVIVSKEVLWKYVNWEATMIQRLILDMHHIILTCDNVDRVLTYWMENQHATNYTYHESLKDLATQALILGETHSYCWSKSKLEEVHSQASRKIAIEKFKSVPFKEYEYEGTLPDHPHLTLLTNNRDIFEEGNIMSHCLYSNYENMIGRKRYFAFSYKSETERGTLGVAISYEGKAQFSQFYGKKNTTLSPEAHEEVKAYISREDVQKFFDENKWVYETYQEDGAVQPIVMQEVW